MNYTEITGLRGHALEAPIRASVVRMGRKPLSRLWVWDPKVEIELGDLVRWKDSDVSSGEREERVCNVEAIFFDSDIVGHALYLRPSTDRSCECANGIRN